MLSPATKADEAPHQPSRLTLYQYEGIKVSIDQLHPGTQSREVLKGFTSILSREKSTRSILEIIINNEYLHSVCTPGICIVQ